MTTQYTDEPCFKKKYLAPLIILMLCAVSLTGAAYAYSTSVTGGGDISGEYYSIDMYDTGGAVITKNITAGDGADFIVQTDKIIGGTKDAEGNITNTGNYYATTIPVAGKSTLYTDDTGNKYIQIDFIEKVRVSSNTTPTTETTTPISGEAVYAPNGSSGSFYADWTTDTVKCTVAFDEDGAGAYNLAEIKFNEFYFVKITVLLPVIKDKDTGISDPNDPGDKTGKRLADYLAFNGTGCLTVTLKATNE